jgi:hypothetical protein
LNTITHSEQVQREPFAEDKGGSARGSDSQADLLAALSGLDAGRERAVAFRARRSVMGSLGVIKEQNQGKKRARGVALAVTLVMLMLIAPLIWEATENILAGEHIGDIGSQLALWACVLCPTMLGAALVAGFWKKRS